MLRATKWTLLLVIFVLSFTQISGAAQDSAERAFDPVLDPDYVSDPVDAVYVYVSTALELDRALLQAQPGHVIELADGEYDLGRPFAIRSKRATPEKPIIVRAKNRGQAIIAGNSLIQLENSSYIVIDGLQFKTAQRNSSGFRFQETDHSRVTRSHFVLVEPIGDKNDPSRHWVLVNGFGSTANRIDHNHFEGKRTVGNFITIAGDATRVAQHTRIDHNYFLDVMNIGSGGNEAIRIGNSFTSPSYSLTVIEHNLFERCSGEGEIISIKSGGNIVRYNTFLESEGAVTFRHGNGTSVYGNFFIGNGKPQTGGVRVYGADHKVYNNYFVGLAGTGARAALSLGMADVENQVTVMDYWQVERLLVANNTFVNNNNNIGVVATGDYKLAPKGVLITNNLIVSDTIDPIVNLQSTPQIEWVNNIVEYGPGGRLGVEVDAEAIRLIDPQLKQNANGYYIDAHSPALDSATVLPDVTVDIEGKPRGDNPDIGAFEYAGYPLLRGPLTAANVGPNAIPVPPIDLAASRLYLTTLNLDGTLYPATGWWGPINVEIAAMNTGQLSAPITLSVHIDGAEVYRTIGASAHITVNQGELADGAHRLTVVAESGAERSEKSIEFQVSNMRIESPAQGAKYVREIPVTLAVGMPPALVKTVQLSIADQIFYEGPLENVPSWLDATLLTDGFHRLTATAWSKDGIETRAAVAILIDNYWELDDGLEAPQASWFGVYDRSLTLATSEGWEYATNNVDSFFGDAYRKVRSTKNQEWLIWETPRLLEAAVTIYAQDEDLRSQLMLAISKDQEQWVEVPYEVQSLEESAEGWHKLSLTAVIADPSAVQFFRLTVAAGQHSAQELQMGHVFLTGQQQ